jgi:hypothetical protein
MIDADSRIEDLVREHPVTVRLLMERGIACIACGEPIWGSLGDAARAKGLTAGEIGALADELRELVRRAETGDA